MNEKDLNALIRMAAEAERLEEPAGARFEWARADGAERQLRVRKMITGVATLAAAACLGFAAISWLKPAQPVAPGSSGPIAIEKAPAVTPAVVEKATDVALPVPTSPLGAVLLAVFSDKENNCSCLQLNPADFKGDLASWGSEDLVRMARETRCQDDPTRVLVIAMEGPKDKLPSSTAEAELLAAAVRENTPHCGDDICFTQTAAPFVPAGVRVVAGSMALR
jgi:hypothetical protein